MNLLIRYISIGTTPHTNTPFIAVLKSILKIFSSRIKGERKPLRDLGQRIWGFNVRYRKFLSF